MELVELGADGLDGAAEDGPVDVGGEGAVEGDGRLLGVPGGVGVERRCVGVGLEGVGDDVEKVVHGRIQGLGGCLTQRRKGAKKRKSKSKSGSKKEEGGRRGCYGLEVCWSWSGG